MAAIVTRRDVMKTLTSAALLNPAGAFASRLCAPFMVDRTGRELRYEVMPQTAANPRGLGVFSRKGSGWKQQQFVPGEGLQLILLGHSKTHLYAAHQADPVTRTSGWVEVHGVDANTGLLTSLASRDLALSARQPSAMALNSTGDLLVVAASGGIFSLLAVCAETGLQEVTAVHKRLGEQRQDQAMELHFMGAELLRVSDEQDERHYRCDKNGMSACGTVGPERKGSRS